MIGKGSKFYNRLLIWWLKDEDTEFYSTYNESKWAISEPFITSIIERSLQIYETFISKVVYSNIFPALADEYIKLIHKYNKAVHRRIKLKPADFRPDTYI